MVIPFVYEANDVFELVEDHLQDLAAGKPLLVNVEFMPSSQLSILVEDPDLILKHRLDGVTEINMVERA